MVSARIVTADGEVLTISETENEGLFWGVRGAGFNFGIVISATYKLHRLADNNNGEILTADFIIPANKTLFYFDWLESLSETMPPNAAGVSRFQFDSTTKEVSRIISLLGTHTPNLTMNARAKSEQTGCSLARKTRAANS